MAKPLRKQRILRPDVHGFTEHLSLKDLKVQVVVRGLDFDLVTEYGIWKLRSWLVSHFDDDQDRSLLKQYDDHVEDILISRKVCNSLLDPVFRLSGTVNDDGSTSRGSNVKRLYHKKPKKARSEDGLIIGTKKYLVFEMVKLGKSKQEVIDQVGENFEDVNTKSISNWYNRAKKKFSK